MKVDYYLNLDFYLINHIFFQRAEDKTEYISLVTRTIISLDIDNTTDRITTINRIANLRQDIPFILDILIFSDGFSFANKTLRNKYYTICKLCKFNLDKKLQFGIDDMEAEEMLLKEALTCELNGYAKIELLFKFGQTYEALGVNAKRDYYFNLLRSESYDISPTTVCQFYKQVAELYLAKSDFLTATSWLKETLLIDPKFPVKRKIQQLEKQVDYR